MAQFVEVIVLRRAAAHATAVTPAIILAAGASIRMGTPKAQLPFRSGTFLSCLTERLAALCDPVIVVSGAHPLDPSWPAMVIANPDWTKGQLSSLQCGLRAIPAEASEALFTLVDHPDPAESTVAALLRSAGPIAVPVYRGTHGHPVFLRQPVIRELLALDPSASAKEVFRRRVSDTDYIPVDDAGVTDDVDDAKALQRFRFRTEGL